MLALMANDAELLAAFEAQIRQDTGPDLAGWVVERVGPVLRATAPPASPRGGWVLHTDFAGCSSDEIDSAIRDTVAHFATYGRPWEWKTYSHDEPADLPDRLAAAGLMAEELEALVIGEVDVVVAACADVVVPPGTQIREPTSDADYDGISALHETVWHVDGAERTRELIAEKLADPDALRILVVVVDDTVVAAAWARWHTGTEFASLWGGSTLPQWRHRGVYRALVGRRAVEAAERGLRYLQVDASPDSRPILERLGLRVVSTTTPYVGLGGS
jgi:GNAT superfamily N-acetyltransferase